MIIWLWFFREDHLGRKAWKAHSAAASHTKQGKLQGWSLFWGKDFSHYPLLKGGNGETHQMSPGLLCGTKTRSLGKLVLSLLCQSERFLTGTWQKGQKAWLSNQMLRQAGVQVSPAALAPDEPYNLLGLRSPHVNIFHQWHILCEHFSFIGSERLYCSKEEQYPISSNRLRAVIGVDPVRLASLCLGLLSCSLATLWLCSMESSL